MGQHRTTARPESGPAAGSGRLFASTKFRVGLSLVLAAVLVGGIWVAWDSGREDCTEIRKVSVVVDWGASDYVKALAQQTQTHSCFTYAVEAVAPSHTDERLSRKNKPQIWVAESQARVRQVGDTLQQTWSDMGPSLGTTPVIVATKNTPPPTTWTSVLTMPTIHVDAPARSDVSNAAVVGALAEVSSGALTHRDLVEHLTKRALLMNDEDGTADLAQVAASKTPSGIVTTESDFTRFARKNPESGINISVPDTGTVSVDYRVANVAQPNDERWTNDAIGALVETLQTDEGREIRERFALRNVDLEPLAGEEGAGAITVVKPPARELVDNILRKWTALTQPIRALVVQDVSGSMSRKVGSRSRADLLRDASLFGLKQFPRNTALGYWEFSIDRGGKGTDYREVMPIAPISDIVDGKPVRDQLAVAIRNTLANTHGGTGLYDTTLAAYKAVYDSYDPAYSNSVIIMTDGRNEDRDSITLQNLVSELNIMKNPGRRIPIIAVGISEDADA
ncbi:MAG: substrate-binding domain-containing protein, partial [Gordonia sp. (in: high G+C Gram-positive bacteria)]